MLQLWGDIGFLLFTGSTIIFTLLYLTMSRWYKSFVGTVIAVFSFSVIVLCSYFSLRVWDIAVPGVDWVRLIIFWVLGITMAIASFGFVAVQFGKRGGPIRRRLSKRYDDVNKGNDTNLIEEL